MHRLPEIMCFAGPNGSGKSTITKSVLPFVRGKYINADEIQTATLCPIIDAAIKAEELRELALKNNEDFAFETVLSTTRNVELLKRAKKQGYFIRCIFILTDNPNINVERVCCRVSLGGHDVPKDKIISRYYKSLNMISEIYPLCDRLNTYDNSTEELQRIFKKKDEEIFFFPNTYWSKKRISELINKCEDV